MLVLTRSKDTGFLDKCKHKILESDWKEVSHGKWSSFLLGKALSLLKGEEEKAI